MLPSSEAYESALLATVSNPRSNLGVMRLNVTKHLISEKIDVAQDSYPRSPRARHTEALSRGDATIDFPWPTPLPAMVCSTFVAWNDPSVPHVLQVKINTLPLTPPGTCCAEVGSGKLAGSARSLLQDIWTSLWYRSPKWPWPCKVDADRPESQQL